MNLQQDREALLASLQETVRNLPHLPGVYRYLDETGNNLYFRVRKSDGTYKTAGPIAMT